MKKCPAFRNSVPERETGRESGRVASISAMGVDCVPHELNQPVASSPFYQGFMFNLASIPINFSRGYEKTGAMYDASEADSSNMWFEISGPGPS